MSEEACRSRHRNRLIHRPRTRRRFGRARLPNDLKDPSEATDDDRSTNFVTPKNAPSRGPALDHGSARFSS
jgi:hypothetical protein